MILLRDTREGAGSPHFTEEVIENLIHFKDDKRGFRKEIKILSLMNYMDSLS
jgi:hypothetical protein